eukprot:950494_1
MSAAVANKTMSYIVSRRELQRLMQKYPQHLKEQARKAKPKKDESTWPRSMRIAGYTAVALSIPYSGIIIVAESPRIRDSLEGDPIQTGADGSKTTTTMGQKIVNFVRLYWGHEDHIPYTEYLENIHHKEISLASDTSTVDRKGEAGIQGLIQDDVKVNVWTSSNGGAEQVETLPGHVLVSDIESNRKGMGSFASSSAEKKGDEGEIGLSLSFDDADASNTGGFDSTSSDTTFTDLIEEDISKQKNGISEFTNIWSAWHAFPNTSGVGTDSSSAEPQTKAVTMNREEIELEEISHMIEVLQRDLRDPSCTRDIDEMNIELTELKKRYRGARTSMGITKVSNFLLGKK